MRKRRLQNIVAESSLTLPVVVVAALVLWWLPDGQWAWLSGGSLWAPWGQPLRYVLGLMCYALATYFLLETNSAMALLRIRSRMVSVAFLAMATVIGFLHPLNSASFCVLCLSIAIRGLLLSYEGERPQESVFHAFLALSVGSLIWAPMLLLAVVMLWCQLVYLRNLTWTTFRAALFAMLLPYWLWVAWAAYDGSLPACLMHAQSIIAPVSEPVDALLSGQPLLADTYLRWLNADASHEAFQASAAQQPNGWLATWAAMNNVLWDEGVGNVRAWILAHLPRFAALAYVALMGLTGFIHYLRSSYDDKIRVRMSFYCFMAMQVVVALWLLMQPQHFDVLFPLLLLTSAPPAAHFFALTHTWLTNVWFILSTLMLVALAVLTL